MFSYEKRLQYPVKIANPNPALAKFIISQYGGPDGVRLRREVKFFLRAGRFFYNVALRGGAGCAIINGKARKWPARFRAR